MTNSLDEEIKHCEEVAKTKEKEGSLNQESFMPLNEFMRYRVECLECASEHRQLAEWLKELKAYEEAREEIGCLPIVWEEGAGIRKCIDILDKHLKEVKTDGKEETT